MADEVTERNGVVTVEAKVVEAKPPEKEKKPVSQALAVAKNTAELPLSEAAKVLMASGLVRERETAGQVFAKLSLGRDLGLADIAALTGLTITEKGQILTSAAVLQQLIKRTKRYKLRVAQRDDKGTKIEVWEIDPVSNEWEKCGVPVFFGPVEAKRAKLDTKENYQKWPTEMYFARAIAAAFRTYCPDCMCGVNLYLPDEIEGSGYKTDFTSDGSMVVDAECTVKSRPRKGKAKEDDTLGRVRQLIADTASDETTLTTHYGVKSLEDMTEEQQLDLEGLLKKKLKAAGKAA